MCCHSKPHIIWLDFYSRCPHGSHSLHLFGFGISTRKTGDVVVVTFTTTQIRFFKKVLKVSQDYWLISRNPLRKVIAQRRRSIFLNELISRSLVCAARRFPGDSSSLSLTLSAKLPAFLLPSLSGSSHPQLLPSLNQAGYGHVTIVTAACAHQQKRNANAGTFEGRWLQK